MRGTKQHQTWHKLASCAFCLGLAPFATLAKLSEPIRSEGVSEQHRTLRYLAFFETLAETEEGSPLWHSLSAGLVTLRLVDAWLSRGGSEAGGDQWGVQAVRQQVEQVPAGDPARTIFLGILDEVARPGPADPVRVVPRLMAYGRALDFAGRWALASELYTTVLSFVDPAVDSDLAIGAQFRLAYCQRVLGNLDEAERAYAAAGHLSRVARDEVGSLRSEVGIAKVAMARGNLPAAEKSLDSVISRADQALAAREDQAMREFRATVLHDRATVANYRDQHETAITLLNAALADTRSPSARDRVIADIASSFGAMGARAAARDAYMVVALTAEEQFSRWSATASLLWLAAVDGMEPAFEQYRRQLAEQPLDPETELSVLSSLGYGYRQFGRPAQAREAIDRGIALAERLGYNKRVFEFEEELRLLEAGQRTTTPATVEPPPSVAGVATSMRKMRELALAAGT